MINLPSIFLATAAITLSHLPPGAILSSSGVAGNPTWVVPSQELEVDRLVDIIHDVEHWDGRTTGAAGEWGYWQFTPTLWRRLSKFSHHHATFSQQHAAAEKHIRWIISILPELDLPRTPYSVGLVWAAGYGNILNGRISRSKVEYAKRVRNLYEEGR